MDSCHIDNYALTNETEAASLHDLTVERATSMCTMGTCADGFTLAANKLLASRQRLCGGLYSLKAFPHLLTVDLSSNRLTTLAGLEVLPNLASLVASNNRIQHCLDFPAPDTIAGSRLRLADLSNNSITSLQCPDAEGTKRGIHAHPQVETLRLDNNRFTSLAGFASLESLGTLSLSGNDIQNQADATIGGILPAGLTELDLSHNRHLSEIPAALESLARLRTLALTGCGIENVVLGHGVCATSGIVFWGHDDVQPQVHQAYRWHVAKLLPHVFTLDGAAITTKERAYAATLTLVERGSVCGGRSDAGLEDVAEEVLQRRREIRRSQCSVDEYYATWDV